MLDYLKWWFSTLFCHHDKEEEGRLYDFGRGKAWYCKHCGKCLETL